MAVPKTKGKKISVNTRELYDYNLIKITSLTCSRVLICCSVWDLKKPQ